MLKNELKGYVNSSNLINMKEAGEGIFVLKYKKKVFYDGLWNRFIAECRGTVVDADFNVVSRPFTKIYNYGIEKEAPVLADDVKVTAYRKINGFMVAMTWYNNDILVSTTGSTDSPYVSLAKEMMLKENTWDHWKSVVRDSKGYTLMFECVHPEDPHIILEDAGMYFLGWRENTWDSTVNGYGLAVSKHWQDFALGVLRCKYAEAIHTTIGELVSLTKTVKHEGFVFYTDEGVSSKIKSPYYLTSKWVARNPRTDKLIDLNKDIKHSIDEEYYGLIDTIRANIVEYTNMDEQARLEWVRGQLA